MRKQYFKLFLFIHTQIIFQFPLLKYYQIKSIVENENEKLHLNNHIQYIHYHVLQTWHKAPLKQSYIVHTLSCATDVAQSTTKTIIYSTYIIMCYRRGTKHHLYNHIQYIHHHVLQTWHKAPLKKYLWCFCLLSSVYPYPVHSVHKNIERMEGTVVHSIVICSSLNLKSKSCPKELSLCHKLLFYDLYIFALSYSFDISNSEF